MADTVDWDHGDHQSGALCSVKDCILNLKEKIDEQELPGFVSLIDDWFDPDVPVNEEQFVRRFLHVFKQSEADHTYEDLLKDYDEETQNIFNDFVDGKIDAAEAGKRYHPYEGVKAPKVDGLTRRGGLATLSQQEPDNAPFQEYTGLLWAFPTSIPSRIRRFLAKIAPWIKHRKHALYVKSYHNLTFRNHGRTVEHTPSITCVPETAKDVQDIVIYAKAQKMGVRVSGFRHSWSPVFGRSHANGERNNGDILISTLGLVDATILPNFTSLPTDLFQPRAKDLNSIVVVDEKYVKGPRLTGGKKYVRVGTSTTNEQLRRWCVKTGKVTLPMQIIEVEITMGGSNATICHGAGINNPTLSDQVRAIEYVDSNGKLNKIDMSTPDFLRAAAGCFGLIGIVTHLTLEFDAMSCALMEPRKIPVIQAIPPPPDMSDAEIPPALRPAQPLTQQRKAAIQAEFEYRALNHYYAEWFWFPYSSEVWVNTFNKTSDLTNAVDYPSNAKTILQVFGTLATHIVQNATIILNLTDKQPEKQTKVLTWLAMKNLDDIGPNGQKIKTWLPDAMHFQRGVQNLRVRDLEVEIPLQPKRPGSVLSESSSTELKKENVDEKPEVDLTLAQRAWWDAVIECYKNIDTCPQRMPLEMRIMAESNVTLAPQRGHRLGTCAIEILTLINVADIWPAYAQKVLNKWTNYHDAEGKLIPVRPHWAKEWYGYQAHGRRWEEVLKNEPSANGGFRDELKEWRKAVGELARRDKWKPEDARARFGNEALDDLVWNVSPKAAAKK